MRGLMNALDSNSGYFMMKDVIVSEVSTDNDGRRKKEDRRKFSYTIHIPERRCGIDRRSGEDRRQSSRNGERPRQ